jgi:hypothetical protein
MAVETVEAAASCQIQKMADTVDAAAAERSCLLAAND